MKSPRTIMQFTLVAVALAITAAPASASQYTTTCGSGQYDMLSLMFMQDSYTAVNYYVYGDAYTWNGTGWTLNSSPLVEHTDVVDVLTSHDSGAIWDTGKINSVKDYQGQPDGLSGGQPKYYPVPPYWGYPWDINLFDDNYVYLWITENVWGDAYSYKAFNNGSSNNSMMFTRRCVVPGDDGTTSVLVDSPKGDGTNTTEYFTVPSGTPAYTSSDCNTSTQKDLDYAIVTVEAEQPSSYTLKNTLTNENVSLNIIPVSYQYSCASSTGGCEYQEVYEYGYDASNNNYGLVQWTYYESPSKNGSWTPVSMSVFNNLGQWTSTDVSNGEGGSDVSFPCNPI